MSSTEWIIGIHAVTELLRRNPQDVIELLLQQERSDQRLDEVRALARELGISSKVVPRAELEKKVGAAGRIRAWRRCVSGAIP
jgi:23S rRNA (guanosine2251-2'-O)-methyltransferase